MVAGHRLVPADQKLKRYGCGRIDGDGRALGASQDGDAITAWGQSIRVAHARNGARRARARRLDWLATLDWIFTRYQKIWFPFPHHINLGPGRGTIRRAALYLR